MTKISENDRDQLELAIYLPMVLTVLDRDLIAIQKSSIKLKRPYEEFVEEVMKRVQLDLREVKKYLRQENMSVQETNRDESFTTFLFLYKGYEEYHNYFNPRIRNKVQELITSYFLKNATS
ncbi:hypothetical protein GCM10008967_00970 [Bacillus carboniphilus]|uniref:YhjD n=1 Tax=Bacillus carboniphilus TaxID=86663 RepID=A0ABN0VPV0_9BACI